MTKRLTRRVPGASGLAPLAQSIGRGRSQRNVGFTIARPPSLAPGQYQGRQATAITGGYAARVVPAGGIVTVYCGPMGLGTVWYPQAVAISTTTGANDASTCALYLSPLQNGSTLAPSTQIGGQSYAGGGDTIGVAVPPMWAGLFIVAQWTGAKVGDLAALQVYGQQKTLTA
jgi:hypothetical protein